MKAEHRKELQTNTLADGMGRLVKSIRSKPKKSSLLLWLGVFALIAAVAVFWVLRQANRSREADLWVKLDDGNSRYLNELRTAQANTKAGQAARFNYAWLHLWEIGVKYIDANPSVAVEALKEAESNYNLLYEECKTDPVWGAEALYGIAVAQESLAVTDPEKYLKEASEKYKRVTTDFSSSARAKDARDRLKVLTDTETAPQVTQFYQGMQANYMVNMQHARFLEKLKQSQKANK